MSMEEEFIDKTDRCEIPKFSYVIEYIYDRIVDWYYHVETTKIAKLNVHDNKINYMYEPFPYRKVTHLFKCYPFEENDGFIDIGCGKGRVLIEASLHGCRNIYGVDLCEELLACARVNMRECQKKYPSINYQLLCMNAKNYVFSSDINKVFLYNPFNLKILIKVLKALMCSIEANPRKVTLFLGGPKGILKYMENIKKFRLIAIEENVYVYQYVFDNKVVR